MTHTATAGQKFTSEIRTMFHIGPRTRWYRSEKFGEVLNREQVLERAFAAINYPGYDDQRRTAILNKAHAAMLAWVKHVEGYRIDPVLRREVTEQSPWEWTAYLGRMVDSGCTNVGEFERWFAGQRALVDA